MADSPIQVNIATNSMYVATPFYVVDNDIVFGLMVPPIIADDSDSMYTVTEETENRLDLVANIAYGDPSLFWVIADINDITDPMASVPVGTKLRVATRSRLTDLGITTNGGTI